MGMIGKGLVEAEEQLQQVMAGLQRFQRAAEGLERGQESLQAAALQVERLAEQASHSLAPALEAVATLRRLDPDALLAQTRTVADHLEAALRLNRWLLLLLGGLNTLLLILLLLR